MNKKRSLLVTGGAGFIGSNFIHYWFKHHPDDIIINLDLLTYAGNLANLKNIADHPNYTFVEGNITDRDLVQEIMKDVTHVIHFAAESHVDRSILNPAVFLETNVVGTEVLLSAARDAGVKHFHHISTDEVFGSLELGGNDAFTLDTPYDPRSPYSASKAGSDHLVRAYGETYGLPYTITNCSNNYGEYQYPEKLFGLAITNILEGKKVPVYGAGNQIRDWLYVQDHCAAIDLVIQNGPTQETFLVGGMIKDHTNLEVITMILKLMNKDNSEIEYVKDRAGHDLRYTVDWSYLKDKLGWEPSVTLEEGVEKTIAWYTNNESWWKPLKEQSKDFFKENYKKVS